MKHSLSKRRKNPGEAEEEARKKVLSMLPQDGNPKVWSDLEKKARSEGMSLRTLSKHLDELTNAKLVARDVDTGARPPRVYYQLRTSEVFHGMIESMPPEAVDAKSLVARIGKINNPKLREQAFGELLDFQLSLLVLELLRTWEFGITFSENQQTQRFYRIMIASYLAPMIVNLGSLCRAHGDVAPNFLTNFFTRHAENCNRAGAKLLGIEAADFETKGK